MTNVDNTNVYIGKSKNRSEGCELYPLKFLDEVGLVNDDIMVSADI